MKLSTCSRTILVGVDQSGALRANGHYRPLAACLIQDETVSVAYLEALSLASIRTQFALSVDALPDAVAVDAVLGLPRSVSVSWRAAVSRAADIPRGGRDIASAFFAELGRGQVHWRKTDRECGAQSLFLEKPFQRNVQTGSFRIWQDLGRHPGEFYVPGLGESEGQVALYEGYPSLAWKILTGTRGRDVTTLVANSPILKGIQICTRTLEKIRKDPNLADALMLALQLKSCHSRGLEFRPSSEGHILGA